MCILVISNFLRVFDHSRFVQVSKSVQAHIDDARTKQRAVAFVQSQQSAGFDEMGVRIGRFDPIFRMRPCESILPFGLTDFILGHAPKRVSVIGMTTRDQFLQIVRTLNQAGIAAGGEANAILLSAHLARSGLHRGEAASQFIENDALTWSWREGSASKKNQSTRWPSV